MPQSILAYGRTGTTKTSQIRYIALDTWKRFKKRTRMITSDTGSLWNPLEDLVAAGIIEPLLFPTDPSYMPLSAMRKLRRGMWPKGGKMVPFTQDAQEKWHGKQEWVPWGPEEAETVGAYAVESLTSYGSGILRDLAEKGITVGTGSVPGKRMEQGEVFASNTMQHYGMGQTEILELLNGFVSLPIETFYVTALEGIGEDDDAATKRPVLGPKSLGKAITEIIPQRVGDCLHFVDHVEGAKREVRCYVAPHADSMVQKMTWPAKVRLLNTPEVLNAFAKRYPSGYFTLSIEKGIGELLEFKQEMAEVAREAILKASA